MYFIVSLFLFSCVTWIYLNCNLKPFSCHYSSNFNSTSYGVSIQFKFTLMNWKDDLEQLQTIRAISCNCSLTIILRPILQIQYYNLVIAQLFVSQCNDIFNFGKWELECRTLTGSDRLPICNWYFNNIKQIQTTNNGTVCGWVNVWGRLEDMNFCEVQKGTKRK